MTIILIFIGLSVLNVILQTVKSILTIKSGKWVAAFISMVTYAVYTYVLVWTTADTFALWQKAIIVGLANFVGVFIVKLIEEKSRKDKLWKVEFTVKYSPNRFNAIVSFLKEKHIPFQYFLLGGHIKFDTYCQTQADSIVVAELIKIHKGKYFISECKTMF